MSRELLVIRHSEKNHQTGMLTQRGKQRAYERAPAISSLGFKKAIVAPNDRCQQTARCMRLQIIYEMPLLVTPDNVSEAYLNDAIVRRMLKQQCKPMERSYLQAVLDDERREDFIDWGRRLAAEIIHVGKNQYENIVLVGCSPAVELAYLGMINDFDWELFPKCRNLDGFFYTYTTGTCRQLLSG